MATKTGLHSRIPHERIGNFASGAETVFVSEFTDGILDPAAHARAVRDGGHIVANTAQGAGDR